MMAPYHYSVVRCRDNVVNGERRNVGLLVVSPTSRKAWLRRGQLHIRAHLLGDDAVFVRALLDMLEEEAKEVARSGAPEIVHEWLRSRSGPTEDTVVLGEPAIGVADDITQEVRRLAVMYLGKTSGPQKTVAEKLRDEVLRTLGALRSFAPKEFPSGPATWRFPTVNEQPGGALVLNALHFGQRKPEGVLDATFKNIGRAEEVRLHHPSTEMLTVVSGPTGGATGQALVRAHELMDGVGLNIVRPTAEALVAVLRAKGFGAAADDEGLAHA